MAGRDRPLPLEKFRNAIADGLWTLSAGDVPGACTRLGLAPGTKEEAFHSKRKYVHSRIASLQGPELIALAQAILREYDIANLADFVSELTTHAEHRLTELTRCSALEMLDPLDPLFGQTALMDGLATLTPDWEKPSTYSARQGSTLQYDVQQHYVDNPDLSNSKVLILCGALTCSQAKFFALLELLTNPLSRKRAEQEKLVAALNETLAADGFALVLAGQMSRHPVYAVRRLQGGVAGAAKNIIFAAVNAKPDLVFTDAINNDVAIVNDSDALVYDRTIPETGLSWASLVEWWANLNQVANDGNAGRRLYSRLAAAVQATTSPGEYALFHTYFKEFVPALADDLPALMPQVYLHFDPKTAAQRGSNQVLVRQRMDLLLLLDHGVRIVVEVDGRHHYADGEAASPARYAAMAAEDRRLRLHGYEVYRFGAAEFADTDRSGERWEVGAKSAALAKDFFERLFLKHPPRRLTGKTTGLRRWQAI